MKTHRSTLHVSMQEQTVPADDSNGSTRADSLGRAARGIAILALVLGSSLGAEAAVTGTAHVTALKMPTPSAAKPHMVAHRPWMY